MKGTKEILLVMAAVLLLSVCSKPTEKQVESSANATSTSAPEINGSPSPDIPNLQAEILDKRGKTTDSPLGKFDFRNFTYPGPTDYDQTFTLKDGKKEAVSRKEDGYSLLDVKYFDTTADGEKDAVVVIGVQTAVRPHLF